jgi:magnesium transporter
VPLCISTGGNSGSQAATLITRALALGQVTPAGWARVIRHELLMGLMLGLTLGVIGFVRGALTPEDVRGNIARSKDPFQLKVPITSPREDIRKHGETREIIPAGAVKISTVDARLQLIPPDGYELRVDESSEPGMRIYHCPAETMVRTEAVSRWSLAGVVSMAVAAICLWGTLVGSMLPLVFKRFGVDPGIASSPFVATFVDVTGIIIYFNIAQFFLLTN